ncbi:MAG: hypothetical protein RLN95_02600, partial [Nitratireductor sp.]
MEEAVHVLSRPMADGNAVVSTLLWLMPKAIVRPRIGQSRRGRVDTGLQFSEKEERTMFRSRVRDSVMDFAGVRSA